MLRIFNCVSVASLYRSPIQRIPKFIKPKFTAMSTISTDNSLVEVRKVLTNIGVDAFLVGSGDAHQSEYVCARDMRRQFISKFTGSAGTALILQNSAYLWTDGRYFLQAENELSADWTLMRAGDLGVPDLQSWVLDNLGSGQSLGIDASLMTALEAKNMIKAFEAKNIRLVSVDQNPVDLVWASQQPAAPTNPVIVHGADRAGVSHTEKISHVQAEIAKAGATAQVISMLDEVVWLFNIRGSDVEYNPVVISYAVVTLDKSYLFVDPAKVSATVQNDHLGQSVVVLPYTEIESFLVAQAKEGKVLVDPSQLNWRLYQALGSSAVDKVSPVVLPKSVKNDVELNGIRQAHIRDGAALTAFIHWLENTVKAAPNTISETDAMAKLEEFRGRVVDHRGPSFATIAGYGPNGAIIHYHAEPATAAKIGTDSMFLLDSGGQYLDGTTDVTRTMHFGVPTQRMKDCYTAVMKGHIAFAQLVMPAGTVGSRFDAVARLALWNLGLDYNHGTGHGVGAYLNVHEGPQGVGFRARANEAGFQAGMTISNEPGYYENGAFGIRIETVCITVEKATPNNFNGKQYLGFETVTMTPMKTDLLNVDMLTDGEIDWLNAYHRTVREKLSPGVKANFPESLEYLIRETEPIARVPKTL